MDLNKIKKQISSGVSKDYHPKNLDAIIDLFIQVISFPIDVVDLMGIPEAYINALEKLFEKEQKDDTCRVVIHSEKLLKKILYLVDYKEYTTIKSNKDGFSAIIEALALNPNGINFNWDDLKPYQKTNYAEHLMTAYKVRNIESHSCQQFSTIEFYQIVKSVLIVYLWTIEKYYTVIYKRLNYVDKSLFLDNVKRNFEKWSKRFVSINGKEQVEVALYAIEQKIIDTDENIREGKIEDLRMQLIKDKQNQMIIAGEAGIGKTTTMQYLAYRDAIAGKFPIYIELKLLTKNDTIYGKISEKIKTIKNYTTLFTSTDTCIFLDGLNEVLPSIKDEIYREIIALIAKYPKVFFLISTRPQDYKGQLINIPVFILQKMDMIKINDFLKKNTDNENVRNIIKNAVEKNDNWFKILGNPLILFMLIQIVSIEKELPDDKNKIIIRFIKNLYRREKEKEFSFDEVLFHNTISQVAFSCIDKVGNTNSGFSFASLKKLIDTDLSDDKLLSIIRKGVELNILVVNDNLYSFSHQLYQDTLAGDYLNSLQ